MTWRNDRLWHAVHNAHADNVNVKVLRNGQIEVVGYVVAIADDWFKVRDIDHKAHRFRFNEDDAQLRIER